MPMINFTARISRLIERFIDAVEGIATEMKRANNLKELEINRVPPKEGE